MIEHPRPVLDATPDDSRLVVWERGTTVRVLDRASLRALAAFELPLPPLAIRVRDDGSIASLDRERTLLVHDVDGRLLARSSLPEALRPTDAEITAAALDTSGTYIGLVQGDYHANVWSIEREEIVCAASSLFDSSMSERESVDVALSPDGGLALITYQTCPFPGSFGDSCGSWGRGWVLVDVATEAIVTENSDIPIDLADGRSVAALSREHRRVLIASPDLVSYAPIQLICLDVDPSEDLCHAKFNNMGGASAAAFSRAGESFAVAFTTDAAQISSRVRVLVGRLGAQMEWGWFEPRRDEDVVALAIVDDTVVTLDVRGGIAVEPIGPLLVT